MTEDRDRMVDLRAWLQDDPTTLPDRGDALRRTIERVTLTPQRSRWLPIPARRRHQATGRNGANRRSGMIPFPVMLAAVVAAGGALTGTALLLSDPDPSPRVIVVAQDGSGDVATITEAVTLATDGDTVRVRPGTYRESVRVTADITIRGDGDPRSVIIEVPEDGAEVPEAAGPERDGYYGLFLEATDARIENVHVQGLQSGKAVVLRGGSPVLDGVSVELAGFFAGTPERPHEGLIIDEGSTAVLRDISVEGWVDIIGSPTFSGSDFPDTCISIGSVGSAPTFSGSTFRGCPYGWAISVGDGTCCGAPGASATIHDSDITAPAGPAVVVSGPGSSLSLTGSTIHDSSTGVQVGPGSVATIEGNEIVSNLTGVRLTRTDAATVIRDNRVSRGSTGLIITGASPTIEGNEVHANGTGLAIQGPASAPVLRGNTICGNDQDVRVASGAADPDRSGDEACPEPAPSGSSAP